MDSLEWEYLHESRLSDHRHRVIPFMLKTSVSSGSKMVLKRYAQWCTASRRDWGSGWGFQHRATLVSQEPQTIRLCRVGSLHADRNIAELVTQDILKINSDHL
jgi:hypothetical protein